MNIVLRTRIDRAIIKLRIFFFLKRYLHKNAGRKFIARQSIRCINFKSDTSKLADATSLRPATCILRLM